MNPTELLARIKAAGHWRVVLRPTVHEARRVTSLSACWHLLESNQVRLRGWYFPHLSNNHRQNMDGWIESGSDWQDELEYWRFYQSGQFLHYHSFIENFHEVPWRSSEYPGRGKPQKCLEIVSTLYRISEIYEFASRLAQRGVMDPECEIQIDLTDTQERELVFWTIDRFLSGRYVSQLEKISFHATHSQDELVAKSAEFALDAAIYVFERFNWNNPPREVLAEDQRRLLERRLR